MSLPIARYARLGVERLGASRRLTSIRAQISRRVRLLAAIAFAVLLALFIWQEADQFPALWRTVLGADPAWLAAAVALECGLIGMTALGYRVILHRLGHRCAWRSLLGIYLRATVAGSLVPIGEPAAAVVVVNGLGEHGVPRDDAFLVWSLADAVGFAGVFALLVPTVGLLAIEGRLPLPVLLGAGVMTMLILLVAGALAMVLHGGRLARPFERLVPGRLDAFLGRARRHRLGLRGLLPAIALSVLGELGSVALLALVLRAVARQSLDPVVSLTAYEVGIAARMLSPIYQGTGAVEFSTATTLQRQHVTPAAALAATLLFRALSLWLPVLAGLVWHGIGRFLPGLSARRRPSPTGTP